MVLVTLREIPITQSRKKTCMTSWVTKSAVQVHDTLVTEILWKSLSAEGASKGGAKPNARRTSVGVC